MPTKPNKVQGAGVAVFADGGILSRLQSVTADTDLGVEEIREISNSSVVEFVEGSPTVAVQLEANQVGKRSNVAYLTGQDGIFQTEMITPGGGNQDPGTTREITHFSFDGTQTDLVMQIEEDSVLKRSIYMPDCFMTALSWNFDVGGVATESYSLESDDKRVFANTKRELVVLSGYYLGTGEAGTSGFYTTPHPALDLDDAGTYINASGFSTACPAAEQFTAIEASLNGSVIKNASTGATLVTYGGDEEDNNFVRFENGTTRTPALAAGRLRVLGYKTTPNTNISADTTLAAGDFPTGLNIGGVRKGMVEIFLVSGAVWMNEGRLNPTEYLRLQTCSIDVDLAREALEELGNPEAYARSLQFPISATVNFSALASDIQSWAAFSDRLITYGTEAIDEIGFRDFVQTAGVLIKLYDDDETNAARKHLMTITVSGVRVASESFSVDAGGNAVQEFSCSADNFIIS
jgi:hypothetical protein